jgi:hypothetical protein
MNQDQLEITDEIKEVTIELRKFGPKRGTHPSIGTKCPACGEEFKEGEYTTIPTFGPGGDPGERAKARANQPYNAVGWEIHWACATGEE